MQCYEISVGLVSKIKSPGPPASFYTSLRGATTMFMGLKEKIEGKRGVKHMKKLSRNGGRGDLAYHTEQKGRGQVGDWGTQHSSII